MSAKHTPGPLTVSVQDRWPFKILTKDAAGNVVFATDMPCNSTSHKSAAECLAGVGMNPEWNAAEHNARALADEVLRAAAPNLAFQLLAAANYIDALGGDSRSYRQAYEAATGETA